MGTGVVVRLGRGYRDGGEGRGMVVRVVMVRVEGAWGYCLVYVW